MTRTRVGSGFRRLREAVAEHGPLQPLTPGIYAIAHTLFEQRSDQRARLTDWLVRHVADRADPASRVLSVGCGDGSVDVHVAAALAASGRRVDYVGVEPHAPSGRRFLDRMDEIDGVRATLLTDTFARARPEGRFDVVLAVHSLYYVDDLAGTLRRACAMLAPGGQLVVLHAPLEPLNTLVPLLSPGRRQPFAEQLSRQLRATGWSPTVHRIEARLDLTPTGDAELDTNLLEFTVQAQLPDPFVPLVRTALAEQAVPGPGLILPHPVDAFVLDHGPRDRTNRALSVHGVSILS